MKNKIERLEEISERISDDDTKISSAIGFLSEAKKIHEDLARKLFKKKGEILIVEQKTPGVHSLEKFKEET